MGLGYVVKADGAIREGIRIVRLKKDAQHPAASPLEEAALRSGLYPLVRPLYQYTKGYPTGKLRAFIQFESSALGQQIIRQSGYLSPRPKLLEANISSETSPTAIENAHDLDEGNR